MSALARRYPMSLPAVQKHVAVLEEAGPVCKRRVIYFMTGPGREKSAGDWDVLEVDAPRRFVVEDGFADDAGQPDLAPAAITSPPLVRPTVELRAKERRCASSSVIS